MAGVDMVLDRYTTTINKIKNDVWDVTMYTIADSNNIPQHEPGAKLDNGKVDMSLLLMFGKALTEVARVGTAGAKKYTRGGWQSVPDGINRYTAAMGRHLMKEHYEKIDSDPELAKYDDGIMHMAQVAWNALARLELTLREQDGK